MWAVSRATTSIILSRQRLSKKVLKDLLIGSSSKLNAQGAKCQSCVFFDAMPFLMELKDDDICGRGLCFVQCDFAAVIVKFAHLLIFLESF